MSSVVQEFGERVRQLRLERRLSVADLAERLDQSASMIETIERGDSPPSFARMVAIAQALRVDVVYLFVVPGKNPLHDLFELTRRANKPAVKAMRGACDGLLRSLRARTAESWGG